MKTLIFSLPIPALLAVVFLGACSSLQNPPLPTASNVTLSRYTGKWYEISRLPNSFQKDNSKATAEYTAQQDGTIKVVNTEIHPDGTTKQALGSATPVPGSNNARLRVKFSGLAALAPDPEEGNYWIIKRADDYSVALVGTPSRKYLWLLSRDPKLSPEVKQAYIAEAAKQGFDTSRLLYANW